MAINVQKLLDAINASVDVNISLERTLNNPNPYGTSESDLFGHSVAISDNYAIVGAYAEDDAGGTDSGKAYIFNATSGALLHTLNNPSPVGTSLGDQFGRSVAITDTYAIVGALLEDDAGGADSGKAYIYNTVTGALLHTLNNPNAYDTSAGDRFGVSVAITDTYAIVGAHTEDDAGGDASGKAYIFNTATGALLHTLNNPNAYGTSADDYFGLSVAITDTYAIVGAYFEDDAAGNQSGKAYIFNTATGALLHTLNNPNPVAGDPGPVGPTVGPSYNDFFGLSVAISDTYAIVAAQREDEVAGNQSESGKVYIFSTVTGALLHTLNNPNAYDTVLNDFFGYKVAISGNYVVVSAVNEDDAGGTESGKAYIFNATSGALVLTLDNPNAYNTSAEDQFGWSVGISGNNVIVSARYEDDAGGVQSGKAYIYKISETDRFPRLVGSANSAYDVYTLVDSFSDLPAVDLTNHGAIAYTSISDKYYVANAFRNSWEEIIDIVYPVES